MIEINESMIEMNVLMVPDDKSMANINESMIEIN